MNAVTADVRAMGARELLEAYTLFVQVHHYDPFITPQMYMDYWKAGVTLDALHDEVMRRLGGFAVLTGGHVGD